MANVREAIILAVMDAIFAIVGLLVNVILVFNPNEVLNFSGFHIQLQKLRP